MMRFRAYFQVGRAFVASPLLMATWWLSLSDISVGVILWTVIESNVSIIAAYLPTLGPIFKREHEVRSWIGTFQSYFKRLSLAVSSSKSSKDGTLSHPRVSNADAAHV